MSENSVDTVAENNCEPVFSSAEEVAVTSTEPIYEQGEITEETPEKKTTFKDILTFIKTKIFTPKICNLVLIALGGLTTALCVLQMILWGFGVKDTYLSYWEAIKTLDYINIAVMAFMVLFVVLLIVNAAKSVLSIIKKWHEPRFETVSTFIAFCIFSVFIQRLFEGKSLLISNFTFEPLSKIILGVVIAYAIVRLLVNDFNSRIFPLIFSCGVIFLAVLMFSQNIGNFATFLTSDGSKFQLAELNIYNYLKAGSEIYADGEIQFTLESFFLDSFGVEYASSMGEIIFLLLMQLVAITVSTILPFAALSMIGYLIIGLTGRCYLQYYNLQTCKKVSITMLVASIFSLAATIGLNLMAPSIGTDIVVELNYLNIVVTISLCIVMIIVTSLPWKIFNMIYKHHYATYQKNGGGN